MFHSFTCQYDIPLEEAIAKLKPEIFDRGFYDTNLVNEYQNISSDGKKANTFIFERGEMSQGTCVIIITLDNFQQETSAHVSLYEMRSTFSYIKKLREALDFSMVGKLPHREKEMEGFSEPKKYLYKMKNKIGDVINVKSTVEEQMLEEQKKMESANITSTNPQNSTNGVNIPLEKKPLIEKNPLDHVINKIKLTDKEKQKRRDWKKRGL